MPVLFKENKECRCFLTEDIQPAGNVSVKNCKENCTKYTMIYRRKFNNHLQTFVL